MTGHANRAKRAANRQGPTPARASRVLVGCLWIVGALLLGPDPTAALRFLAGGVVAPAQAEDGADPAAADGSASAPIPIPAPAAVTLEPVAETLGARAYASLLDSGDGGNVLLSPISLEMALGIIGEATTESHRDAIGAAIGIPYDRLAAIDEAVSSDKATLALANALWLGPGYTLTPSYSTRFLSDYGGDVRTVDFATPEAVEAINGWVSDRTDGAIRQIVETLSDRTSMVLTNALYFKGDWLRPFDPEETQDGAFRVDGDRSVTVPMMERAGIFPYTRTPHGQVVRLFYTDPDLTLTLYMASEDADPQAARADSLTWLFRTDHAGSTRPADGTVTLPRLTLETGTELTRLLAALGLGELFADSNAIQGIAGPIPPSVTDVVQRTHLELTEAGTVAAAATAVIGLRSMATERFTFVADRPFHLALHHADIPTPLLVGYVEDPS